MNTEYQKRVIDRLAEVSNGLWEEFGGPGDNLFYRFTVEIRERVKKINELWRAGERFESFESRLILSNKIELVDHLFGLLRRWDADPFLPSYIREEICTFVQRRAMEMWHITSGYLQAYQQGLADGTIDIDQDYGRIIREKVLEELDRMGFSLQKSEAEIIRLRSLIQKHLESYDPLRRKSPPRSTKALRRLQ